MLLTYDMTEQVIGLAVEVHRVAGLVDRQVVGETVAIFVPAHDAPRCSAISAV
jgi:hypothetical protein